MKLCGSFIKYVGLTLLSKALQSSAWAHTDQCISDNVNVMMH
jgi:hypothetical protein